MIGSELNNRYRIIAQLGEGGMGEVYLAEHILLHRKEAIKILQSSLADSEVFSARFRREARATNRVQHPNIVGVYDFGRMPDGRFFLAMEYVEGKPLNDILCHTGPLPIKAVASIFKQLAEAVHHAHSRGVIHRDLKPHNIIITKRRDNDHFVKVLDFGLSKIVGVDVEDSVESHLDGLYGTPAYMAPEQFKGVRDDPRIDIYSLGCIVYELLTGMPPFKGRPMQLVYQHVHETAPRVVESNPNIELSSAFQQLIDACMCKEPDDRFASATELLQAMRRVPEFKVNSPGVRTARGIAETFVDDDTREERISHTVEVGSDQVSNALLEYATAMKLAAETVLDLGNSDSLLLLDIAQLQSVLSELNRVHLETKQLRTQGAAIEQAASEQIAALRFSIGEIEFDGTQREKEGVTAIDRLRGQMKAVTENAERQLRSLVDREISLVAQQAGYEEQLELKCAAVHPRLRGFLSRYQADPAIDAVHDRIEAAAQKLHTLRNTQQ